MKQLPNKPSVNSIILPLIRSLQNLNNTQKKNRFLIAKSKHNCNIFAVNFLFAAVLFSILMFPLSISGQCPGTSCSITIVGAFNGSFTVNPGEKVCLEAGAEFTGTINLNSGTLQNCATATQNFTINLSPSFPGSVINNYGSMSFSGNSTLTDEVTVNNYGTLDFHNLTVSTLAVVNNYNLIHIGDSLNFSSSVNNAGDLFVDGSINANAESDFSNSGTVTTGNLSVDNTWINDGGTIAVYGNSVFGAGSSGQINGGCINTFDFTNEGTINGTTCGDIIVNDTSANLATGSLTGDFALVDLSPPASSPFIDINNGTIGAGITYLSCNSCPPMEEICANSNDDNGDGRIDEPFPGGVQTDMQLWLKAETGTNTTIDGNDITSWADQSVNGYSANADVNSTDDPIYATNAINYNPGVEFDGTYTDDFSDGLHLGSDYIYSANAGMHIFAIVSPRLLGVSQYKYVYNFGGTVADGVALAWDINNSRINTPTGHGGVTAFNANSTGQIPSLLEYEIEFTNDQGLYRNGNLVSTNPIPGLTQITNAEIGESDHYGTSANSDDEIGPVSIGRKSASIFLSQDRIFDGYISEILVFSDTLSSFEKEKINSYLAVKYGITLNQDYVSSSGAVKKDISDGFVNAIAGIGRDDCSGLHQKQSKSIESDAIITIAKGGLAATNSQNANSISSDDTFLVWGNDGAAANTTWNSATVSIPGIDFSRIDRTWSFTESFDVTNVLFQVEVDNPNFDLPPIPPAADYYLLQDDDGDFTNGGTTHTLMTNSLGDKWETIIADPQNGYFTIGIVSFCQAKAPVLTK